jgi:hypothetical protein
VILNFTKRKLKINISGMNIKVDPDVKEMQSKNQIIDDNQNVFNNNVRNSFSKNIFNQSDNFNSKIGENHSKLIKKELNSDKEFLENEKRNSNPISKE